MKPLRTLGFLTIGLFEASDPATGHESTLQIIELAERLGFDSAWVRHRHLQYGISSPVAVLAAVSQRTNHIALGTAVIPLGWENPLRLAEDLATVDILSRGRLHPGVSVGPPRNFEKLRQSLYPDTADREDFSYERVRRLLDLVSGAPASSFSGTEGFEEFSDRVRPHATGLIDRMWYGGGSVRSARWAGENGMNLLASNVVRFEGQPDFAQAQLTHIRAFRAGNPGGRVSQGLVVIPTDTASTAQREKYTEYVRRRHPRTAEPQGPARLMFSPDFIGTSAEIAERLAEHVAFREVDEVAFALPFTFEHSDYVQILTDIANQLGPRLGWQRPS